LEVLKNCKKITDRLGLAKTYEDAVINLVMGAMEGKWKRGKGAELIIASCGYILCRQNAMPTTLLEVAV
jgi:transcription initiation factor TFIIIB Brf1 subunit/transcription initiation factor TFIIB